MLRISLSPVLISALLLILITKVGAQGPATGFKFSCASWERMEGSPIHYLAGKAKRDESPEDKLARLEEVDAPEMTRSLVYEFKTGRKISFYRTKKNAAGALTLDPVASVTVPSEWSRVLFVFFPGEKKGTYRIYPLRDDRKYAPFGSYQFINLTSHSLEGFIDKEKIGLKPKAKSIVKFSGAEPRSLNFAVWTTIDGKKKYLQRNTLTYRPKKYLVYFFFAAKDVQGRLKVKSKGIVDFMPPPEPKPGEGSPDPEESGDDGA